MATMTFLTTLDGTAAYQHTGGTGTMILNNPVWGTGKFAGTQAPIPTDGSSNNQVPYLAAVPSGISAVEGAAAVWVNMPAVDNSRIIGFGNLGASHPDSMGFVRQGNAINHHNLANGWSGTLTSGFPTSGWVLFFFGWNSTELMATYNDQAIGTIRARPGTKDTFTGEMAIGSIPNERHNGEVGTGIGPVACFDTMPSSTERANLYNATEMWTWQMDLSGGGGPGIFVKSGGTVAEAVGYKAKIGGTLVDVTHE